MFTNDKKENSMARPKKIPACSNCGSRATLRTGSGWGAVKVLYDEYGRQVDVDASKINYTASSVVRCAACKKVRKDIALPAANLTRR